MAIETISTFTVMVTLLTMMPGPNGALLLRTVPILGRSAGVINLAGIVAAFWIHGCLSIVGLSAIVLSSANAFFLIKLVGAGYLLYLGSVSLWKAITKAIVDKSPATTTTSTDQSKVPTRFIEGLLTNLLNPKVSMFYLAAFPQFINFSGSHFMEASLLVLIHSVVVVIWFSIIIFALSSATEIAKNEWYQRALHGATGTLLIWFGYRLLTYEHSAS